MHKGITVITSIKMKKDQHPHINQGSSGGHSRAAADQAKSVEISLVSVTEIE